MPKSFSFNFDNLDAEDKVAMAEAYRVYEMLDEYDQLKIPQNFIETIHRFGDLVNVKPFDSKKEFDDYKFSEKGKYLLMYMCTFNNEN